MEYEIGDLETMVGALLAKKKAPTREDIRRQIKAVREGFAIYSVTDEDAENLAKQFEERHGVTMTIGSVLQAQDYEPWLPERSSKIDPYYWERYRQLLAEKQFSGDVIATVDIVTDRIAGLLENPEKSGPWDRRGMVIGHVQSGKTANYTGLICKAADAGYKLIIVIAGINNNLRNQTQERIDEGFIGVDSSRLLSKKSNRYVGVGKYDKKRRPSSFTNTVRDFNKAMATGLGIPLENLKEPAVFVIKKNSTTLKYLLEWLVEHNTATGSKSIALPMLLIDDEADNASINIRHSKDEVSRINGQIRELLRMFSRSCYVGYTATPFANIFIDPDTENEMKGDDLFPRDFIVSLDPPSNYFGPRKVFLNNDETFIRLIHDNEDLLPIKHPIDHQIIGLPASLIEAVRMFVITRAIRLARRQAGQHSSMLVNASRFTNVQEQLRNAIHLVLQDIQSGARVMGSMNEREAIKFPEIKALKAVWQEHFVDSGSDWPTVQNLLNDAASPISVVTVNSKSSGTLNYSDHSKAGLNVIAVGGFSLSRGLTLQGLAVSYFLRNSMMYDTLMQMGRWFGYRPGYEDLCRIWMPEETMGWYAHISESIEMLRVELRSMQAANATPEEFGLKVRRHPTALMVTARNKMGSSKRVIVKIGLGNSFVETALLKRDAVSFDLNRAAARQLVLDLAEAGTPVSGEMSKSASGYLVRKTSAEPILKFLAGFHNHEGSVLTDGDPIRRYIEDRIETELASWDVLFTSLKTDSGNVPSDNSLGIGIRPQRRTEGDKSSNSTLRISNRQRVSSRGVEKSGLTTEQVAQAEKNHRQELEYDGVLPSDHNKINYPDKAYRAVRKRPLLIVHLLTIDPANDPIIKNLSPITAPVVAWSLSFPETATPEDLTEYDVNTTWLREQYNDELDEEEMGGD